MSETSKQAKIDIPLLLGSLIGFGLSLYSFLQHLKLKYSNAPLGCDVNSLVNCSSAYTSNYGEFASIPLGAFGMSFFGILIALSLLPKVVACDKKWILKFQMFALIVGSSVALFLFKVSYFELKVLCPVCTSTHAVTLILMIYVLIKYVREKGPADAQEGAFAKLLSLALALSVPPIVAGVIVPTFAPSLMKKKSEEAPAAITAPVNQNLSPEYFEFSKSSYVGAGEDFRYGADDAKVVVFEYFDFECPHCKFAYQALHEAVDRVGKDKVLVVFRNYPLSNQCNAGVSSEGHRYACPAALAARCAGVQGKYEAYASWIFATQDTNESDKASLLSEEGLIKQAQTLGLNKETFKNCLTNKTELPKIKDDIRIANGLGIKGTPMIYINKKLFTGHSSQADSLQAAIESELK